MKSNVVYQIKIGPKKQIGSTSVFEKRMYRHLHFLKKGCHWNTHMQFSYNKYNNFSYEILFEFDTREEAYKKESIKLITYLCPKIMLMLEKISYVLIILGLILKAGKPYCTICSKMALDVGIAEFVLWHEEGITVYDTKEYNELSFQYVP